jgi:hypothetical protein
MPPPPINIDLSFEPVKLEPLLATPIEVAPAAFSKKCKFRGCEEKATAAPARPGR